MPGLYSGINNEKERRGAERCPKSVKKVGDLCAELFRFFSENYRKDRIDPG